MSSDGREDGRRLHANLGLRQTWQFAERWTLDAGLDHGRTVSGSDTSYHDAAGFPSSGVPDDFTAVALGLGYREVAWSWTCRGEYRHTQDEKKWLASAGIYGEPTENLGLSAAGRLVRTAPSGGSVGTLGRVRLGLAFRPTDSRWTVLDRLDVIADERGGEAESLGRRVVNNLNLNVRAGDRTQIGAQYGAKYVTEEIQGRRYEGYTDLAGLEARYDLSERWDVGIRASALHSWNSGVIEYSAGGSVGVSIVDNTWVSVGYNFFGFEDKDFSGASYAAHGPYLTLRARFDQESVRDVLAWFGE